MRIARITGFGAYLPKKIVSNYDLEHSLNTTDEWIRTRTGITCRHIAEPSETATFMGIEAAFQALDYAAIPVEQIDAILVATSTPDQVFPSTAVRIQAGLGLHRGFAMDLSAACSGFVYGLGVANSLIRSGQCRNILIIGSEVYSRILDWSDRSTCVLFGDGAGAILLTSVDIDCDDKISIRQAGLHSVHLHSDGSYGELLYIDGALGVPGGEGVLKMSGKDVFRHAVEKLFAVVDEVLEENNLSTEDINWLIPHQANLRIIDALRKKLKLPQDRVIVSVDKHANTSAASIPLALNQAIRDGRIKSGDSVLMEALGGGLTWGAAFARL